MTNDGTLDVFKPCPITRPIQPFDEIEYIMDVCFELCGVYGEDREEKIEEARRRLGPHIDYLKDSIEEAKWARLEKLNRKMKEAEAIAKE